MTKNPYINALCASAYIVFVVMLVTYGPFLVREKPDTILAPISMLSLLVMSVVFMSYAFFLQPVLLFTEGKKREAVEHFTKSLITFAVLTTVIVGIAFTM